MSKFKMVAIALVALVSISVLGGCTACNSCKAEVADCGCGEPCSDCDK